MCKTFHVFHKNTHMEISLLSSSLSKGNPFHSLTLLSSSNSNQRQSQKLKVCVVSCRAAKLGCEVDTSSANFYKILSLSPKSATKDDIKRAYRSMALRYHPDVCHDPSMKKESTSMFVLLNAAYETLSDPVLRQDYDCELGLMSRSYDEKWRNTIWQEQIAELKRRSNRRMAQKDGSWGCRVRAQNLKKR